MHAESNYYFERAVEELERAKIASSEAAAELHLRLSALLMAEARLNGLGHGWSGEERDTLFDPDGSASG